MKQTKIGKIIIAAVTALFVAAVTTGCNTVRGAGQDIESVGSAISENV
jgi:predicted small secreted protein